jgi:daunorubicin/doxorubicin transport system permease protein
VSNVFVDPATIPRGLRHSQPHISHLATADRGLVQGTASAGHVLWVLPAAAMLTAVFAPLTMSLYQRKR